MLTTRVCSDSTVLAVEKRKLNCTCASPGITLVAPVPAWKLEICQVVGGKYSLPRSHSMLCEFGDRRGDLVDRVFRKLRIGDVALHAFHRERAGERAAAAVLDHVAELADRGRLADDAVIEFLAALRERLDHAHRAVDGGPLLVGSEQHRDRAGVIGMLADEIRDRRDERRDRGFHVGSAAAVEHAVPDRRRERVALPQCRAGRSARRRCVPRNTPAARRCRAAPTGWSTPFMLIFSHLKPERLQDRRSPCRGSRRHRATPSGARSVVWRVPAYRFPRNGLPVRVGRVHRILTNSR